MNCKICQSATEHFGEATLIAKHKAEYSRCTACGFIFAREPRWLSEAYSSAMTSTDMGHVSRTDQNSLRTKAVIDLFFHSTKRFLDYGAGYGMFVRRMRDKGYNFFAYDTYCENLFSKQFLLTDLSREKFDLVTAFEVFEHLENPADVFANVLERSDNLLFSTELLPEPNPPLSGWWYYGIEHGQHISFYTFKSLQKVAAIHDRHLTSWGNLHLLSRKPVSLFWYRKATDNRNSEWLGLWRRRPSLLEQDWQDLRKEVLTKLGYPV